MSATMRSRSSTEPNSTTMRPLRHTYIQKPMKIPSGIVMAMVNVPHRLSAAERKAVEELAAASTESPRAHLFSGANPA